CLFCFFFQAEDGIRDFHVTGVQTCALPISISVSVPLFLFINVAKMSVLQTPSLIDIIQNVTESFNSRKVIIDCVLGGSTSVLMSLADIFVRQSRIVLDVWIGSMSFLLLSNVLLLRLIPTTSKTNIKDCLFAISPNRPQGYVFVQGS